MCKKYISLFIIIFITLSSVKAQFIHQDSINVVHYKITLDISDFSTYSISGNTEISFKACHQPIRHIAFDLYKLDIDSIIYSGQLVQQYNYTDTVLSFDIDTAVDSLTSKKCVVYYHGVPSTEPSGGWGGVHHGSSMIYNMGVALSATPHGFGRAWFPCIDNFTDRATYEINLITKSNHVGVSTGLLDSVVTLDSGNKMWKWVFNKTSPTYLISFVVGDLAKYSDIYEGNNDNIPIEIYSLHQDSVAASYLFSSLKNVVALFSNKFGEYFWPKIGYSVVNFNSGAMEHIGNISFPSNSLTNNMGNQILAAHELSHHWFGDQVTCKTAGDMWLNEGWASYCEAIFVEQFYGEGEYLNYVKSNHDYVVLSAHKTDNGYWALSEIPDNLTYSNTVYKKGSLVVNALRNYMGDSLFFSSVKSYLEDYAEKDASSEDLRNSLSSSSGIDLTDFFNTWVFNPGFPQYALEYTNYNNGQLNVSVSQRSVGREFIGNSNRVKLSLIDSAWQVHTHWIQFDGENGTETFPVDFEPRMVIPNMNGAIGDATIRGNVVLKAISSFNSSGVNLNVLPETLTDSVFICVSRHITGPLTTIANLDINVLDCSYWQYDFDAKGEFAARGKFSYDLMNSDISFADADSLIIVYRENANDLWQKVSSMRYGTNEFGFIMVNDLQCGDYALATIPKSTFINDVGNSELFKILPNPSHDGFKIMGDASENYSVQIVSVNGKIIDSFVIPKGTSSRFWNKNNMHKGVYFARVFVNKKVVSVKKVFVD